MAFITIMKCIAFCFFMGTLVKYSLQGVLWLTKVMTIAFNYFGRLGWAFLACQDHSFQVIWRIGRENLVRCIAMLGIHGLFIWKKRKCTVWLQMISLLLAIFQMKLWRLWKEELQPYHHQRSTTKNEAVKGQKKWDCECSAAGMRACFQMDLSCICSFQSNMFIMCFYVLLYVIICYYLLLFVFMISYVIICFYMFLYFLIFFSFFLMFQYFGLSCDELPFDELPQ